MAGLNHLSKCSRNLLVFITIISLILITQFALAAEPTDISNHWAQDYILNMVNNEIMQLDADGTFKPDKAITRGEFTAALARQMNLIPDDNTSLSDLEGYPHYDLINALVKEGIISGYPDGTFKPGKAISRAEMTAIIIKSIGINNEETMINMDNEISFKDVPENHWAEDHIKIAEKLELISGDSENYFNPAKETTRAEAARSLSRLARLSSGTGYITDVYPTSRKVSINHLDGEREVYDYHEGTVVARNNREVELSEILNTDKVFVIADDKGRLDYVKAYGMVTQEDLATEISTMSNNLLDVQEVKELSSGNYDILRPKLQIAIREQLAAQGLTAQEVAAIMSTNWNELEELSKERLAEAIAIQTSLPLDITRSLIEGDWEKIKNYAQIEVIQRLVQEVLNSDLIS